MSSVAKQITTSLQFLGALSQLPKKTQKAARDCVSKFQNNSTCAGLNYETIRNAVDKNMRSLRVDKDYRIILSHPGGSVYFLLWIAKHDDAYDWATRNKLTINPNSGAVQLLEIPCVTVDASKRAAWNDAASAEKTNGFFERFDDESLLKLGVPEELLPATRRVKTEDELDALEKDFPTAAYARLFMLACGEPYENVLQDVVQQENDSFDATDFEKALERDDSKAQFYVISDSAEMAAIFDAPLERWRIFLHPTQRKLAEMNASGPVRVLGSAGSGKTVVAIHRAKYLAEKVFNRPGDRILFTTYTKNLALDIWDRLEDVCENNGDALKRIEVKNLDAWTLNYLKNNGYQSGLVYGFESKLDEFWEKAIALYRPESGAARFSEKFFKDEWAQVVQPQDVFTLNDYYRAKRNGRGWRLDRKDRKEIWPVFEEFRALLSENRLKDSDDLYRDAARLVEREGGERPYRAVIVDEAQDFGPQAFRLIRALTPEGPNDLFVVGDSHQRIYGFPTTLAKCGVNIQGRGKKLRVNYRTTKETYRFAAATLKYLSFDDLDGSEDPLERCQSSTSGPAPQVLNFQTADEEKAAVLKILNDFKDDNVELSDVCIVARKNDILDGFEEFLRECEAPTYRIKEKDDRRVKGLRLATMHRVKGIEFDYVLVVSANAEVLPLKMLVEHENEIDRRLAEKKERALFYVALTRARKRVYVTSFGKPSEFVASNS